MGVKQAGRSGRKPPAGDWTYLESRPHAWKRELWVKGRRVRAGVVYSSMVANSRTPEQTSAAYDLPIEAVQEIIRYCKANWPQIAEENRREQAAAGVESGGEPPAIA